METGLIGLSLSGKTTIFNTLTGHSASTAPHSGGKKEANIAEIQVPDERVDRLSEIFNPKKKVYATCIFKDLNLDFTPEGGISAASIAEIRNLTAVAIVIRAYEDEGVPHPLESIDPVRDLKKILDSLVFSDYEVTEKRMERLEKEGKKGSREFSYLQKISEHLSAGKLLGTGFLTEDEMKLFSGFAFITAKPMIVVANSGEAAKGVAELEAAAGEFDLTFFSLQGALEMEIAQLPGEDQADFLKDAGLSEPAITRFLRMIYDSLNLISFLTVGEDEVRAWSIRKQTVAQKAAGKIHTDLEKGFIRAEVIHYDEFMTMGNMSEAKKQGKLRLEGKEYIVQDGDIMNIRFNV
ncbi:MAG: redox-regulated ATPase YchF [Spirochaetales bacterium]|nr:redox-regulated ATPase YchF [Spirochaetales bacterium]